MLVKTGLRYRLWIFTKTDKNNDFSSHVKTKYALPFVDNQACTVTGHLVDL